MKVTLVFTEGEVRALSDLLRTLKNDMPSYTPTLRLIDLPDRMDSPLRRIEAKMARVVDRVEYANSEGLS